MKVFAAAVAALTFGACATVRPDAVGHWSGLEVLGPLEVGLLYDARSDAPIDPRLAFALGDVCGEREAWARAQAVAAARARLEQAAQAAQEREAWRVPLRQTMGAYDVQKGGFPTGLRSGAVVRFDQADFCRQDLAFLVAFRNGDAYSVLRLSEDGARQVVRANPSRTVVHDLEVEVVGWQPGPPAPTLLVDIVRMRTRDAQTDRVILDTALPEPPAAR